MMTAKQSKTYALVEKIHMLPMSVRDNALDDLHDEMIKIIAFWGDRAKQTKQEIEG